MDGNRKRKLNHLQLRRCGTKHLPSTNCSRPKSISLNIYHQTNRLGCHTIHIRKFYKRLKQRRDLLNVGKRCLLRNVRKSIGQYLTSTFTCIVKLVSYITKDNTIWFIWRNLLPKLCIKRILNPSNESII